MPGMLEENDWTLLLDRIKSGRCTPFLGAGACHGHLPLGTDLAAAWAQKYKCPIPGEPDLLRVSQYLATSMDPMFPKELVCEEFRSCKPPNYDNEDEPHSIL